MPLTWSLSVPTYRRPVVLKECVGCALAQTRPPHEIVIIDASDDWDASKEEISRLLDDSRMAVRLVYEKAVVASSAAQRNQAMAASTSDVVFLIDDDSLMYPDCAEVVMDIYERDVSRRVLAVAAAAAMVAGDDRYADVVVVGEFPVLPPPLGASVDLD
jgi:glycosyltransferase involved in cell wall biosynthesis